MDARNTGVGNARINTVRALHTVRALKESRKEMSTPVFNETLAANVKEQTARPKFMVVYVTGMGPSLACAGCGMFANVYSTDLERLMEWAGSHENTRHS